MRHLAALALCLALLSIGPRAETGDTVSLIADRIEVDRETRTVTASGNVEVHHGGRVLRAASITYSQPEDTIRATGPLVLTDPEGGIVALADFAELTTELTDGLIRNARLLIAGALQVAATEVRRSEGRYTTLFSTVASSCEVCPEAPVPTWAIRAERVISDEEELRVYFRNATLELFGFPVAWLPFLRIPDPTVERASGFLVPEFRRSQIYGAGVKLPYYQVLGPSGDMTLTPFATERGGTLLEGEYRRRLARGGFTLTGVLTLDNVLDGRDGRGAFTARGDHLLGRGFRAEVDLNVTSDDSFLQQFDYSDADRLTSTARIVRSRSTDYLELGTVAFQSLRPDETRATVPFVLPELHYRRLWQEAALGGRIGLDLDALGVIRDGGRDVVRMGGGADWRRDWIVGPGVVAAATAAAAVDVYRIHDDPARNDRTEQRVSPVASVELRWPVARVTGAATHVLEPIVQLAWSDSFGDTEVPNEDSQLPEFDETNLFAHNRFPGRDRVESGLRANLGLGYSRIDPDGWSLDAALGRVLRLEEEDQFARGTGLARPASDWVGVVSLGFDWGLTALNRFRVDGDFELRRNEFGLAYADERSAVAATYVFLARDDTSAVLGPQPESSEVALDARYRFLPNWRVRGDWRYDLSTERHIRAGGGLSYGNECAEFDLSVSRRFTTSANVPPSTSIGFTIRLTGLGTAGTEDWPARSCRG